MAEKTDSAVASFIGDLQELYNAEEQLVLGRTKMAVAAEAPDLRAGLARHLEQTHHHLRRIEQAFSELQRLPMGGDCPDIRTLIAAAEEKLMATHFGPILDRALIDSARKIESFEIAAYRAVIARAYELGFEDMASLLEWNLQEEELCDYQLQRIAEGLNHRIASSSRPKRNGNNRAALGGAL